MRFTEYEMTAAVTAAAQSVHPATRRRDEGEKVAAWAALRPMERYRALTAVGDHILPALVALPEVEVEAGRRPTFTDEQVRTAVEQSLGNVGWLRRRAMTATRASLLKVALAGLPIRQDPENFVVPDYL